MPDRTSQRSTYLTEVRGFDHQRLAALPAYARLRQALSDLANEAGGMRLADWLEAVRDMALTAPYGDTCPRCTKTCAREHDHPDSEPFPRPCGAYALCWPHAAGRHGDHIRGSYTCPQGHTWTCGYTITLPFTL